MALIMLPMMTFAGLIVDGARISSARTSLSGAGDLAMNAALSDYNKILYDVYGLFALSENEEELQKNVERYFRNSLENSGILGDSDSYTREFINSIFGAFSSNDMEFQNIVDVDVDEFELNTVKDSSIANPAVLERQIVDYMKYRAPINLGKGFLTKLGCIGETSKQSKAIENKAEFEKQLDTVQDACEEAYKKITAYNQKVDGDGTKFKDPDYINHLDGDITTSYNKMYELTKYMLAVNNPNFKVDSLYNRPKGVKETIKMAYGSMSAVKLDGELKSNIEEYESSIEVDIEVSPDASDEEKATAEREEQILRTKSTLSYISSQYSGHDIAFMNQLDGNYKNDLAGQVHDIKVYKAIPDSLQIFTLYVLFAEKYTALPDNEREEFKDTYEEIRAVGETLLGLSEFCYNYYQDWIKAVNTNGKEAANLLYSWYKDIVSILEDVDGAISALKTAIDNLKKTDKARVAWANSVSNLSEGDVKTSMQGDYESSAKDLNEAAVQALIDVLDGNKKHFTGLKEKLESIKLNGVAVCIEADDSSDFVAKYKNLGSSDDPIGAANGTFKSKYVTADVKTGITPARFTIIDEKQEFYRFLQKACASIETKEDNGAKEEAKSLKNSLIEAGNKTSYSEASLSSGMPANIDGALPEDVVTAINALYTNEGESDDNFNKTSVDKEDDKKAVDNNKENLSLVSKLLESLGSIMSMLEDLRDDLYMEEYMTEMFSCYMDTIPETEGGPVKAVALNGKDMTGNTFFGAESEYILWGNGSPQKNIDSTKAMLFGIRFALNSVYAFTNTDTRTPALTAATAIAGWTGFGVPIVQTVILLAWSMSESFCDVDFLCQGENVALYKSNRTWYLGYSGLEKKLAETARTLGEKAIDDVFGAIEVAAVDETGKIVGNVQDTIENFTQNTLNGIYDCVQGTIAVPIQELTLQIAGGANELGLGEIKGKVMDTLSKLKTTGDGLANQCTNMAIEYLCENYVDELANQIFDIMKTACNADALNTAVNEKLYGEDGTSGMIGNLKTKVQTAIRNRVEEYGEDFQTKAENWIHSTSGDAKEKLKEELQTFTDGISGGSSQTSGGSMAAATGFTMNYREYLKVFMMIHLMVSDSNADAMLKRTANLIQVNVSQQQSDFDVANAVTLVQAKASANVRTTFFSVPVAITNEDGSTSYDLDFSSIGSGRQKIVYQSILGY